MVFVKCAGSQGCVLRDTCVPHFSQVSGCLVAFGFPLLSLWERFVGVLYMHTLLLTSNVTVDSTLSLNISTLWPWQWFQELLSFLLRLLLVFALEFSFYLPTLYQNRLNSSLTMSRLISQLTWAMILGWSICSSGCKYKCMCACRHTQTH